MKLYHLVTAALLLALAVYAWLATRYSSLQSLSHRHFDHHRATLKRAAQESISASQCANLPLALVSASKGAALADDVLQRLGARHCHDYLGIDVEHLSMTLHAQVHAVLQDLFRQCPDQQPDHAFGGVADWFHHHEDGHHHDHDDDHDHDDKAHAALVHTK